MNPDQKIDLLKRLEYIHTLSRFKQLKAYEELCCECFDTGYHLGHDHIIDAQIQADACIMNPTLTFNTEVKIEVPLTRKIHKIKY